MIALERRRQLLHEMPPRALERHDVGANLPFLGARGLHRLLSSQLGLAQDQLGFAPGIVLHLLDEALGRDQRFLQGPLALRDAAGALLVGRDSLLEHGHLLEHGLVILGDVVEEGVHLLGVVALEHLGRELLLTDVVGGDAHRDLPPYPRLPAI